MRFKTVFHFAQTGKPYLVRYRLVDTRWFGMYVHNFVASDLPVYHDHPWNFYSLMLWGRYREHVPLVFHEETRGVFSVRGYGTWNDRRWLSVVYRKATHQHWVELLDGRRVWTLVVRGRKRRDWGFQTSDGWVQWKKYLASQTPRQRVPPSEATYLPANPAATHLGRLRGRKQRAKRQPPPTTTEKLPAISLDIAPYLSTVVGVEETARLAEFNRLFQTVTDNLRKRRTRQEEITKAEHAVAVEALASLDKVAHEVYAVYAPNLLRSLYEYRALLEEESTDG